MRQVDVQLDPRRTLTCWPSAASTRELSSEAVIESVTEYSATESKPIKRRRSGSARAPTLVIER
jgi:hypothetical protein